MPATTRLQSTEGAANASDRDLVQKLQTYVRATDEIRRGICLLNAGKFDQATVAFSRATVHRDIDKTLASYMASCHIASGRPEEGKRVLEQQLDSEDADVTTYVRCALAAWQDDCRDEATGILREGLVTYPESAELHFQLGILLADTEEYEEAELRFTQAVNIDRNHADALVSLAMCCGLRQSPEEAVKYLKKAQSRKPLDARIALLLTQAMVSAEQRGQVTHMQAVMPSDDPLDDHAGIDELSRVIEADPDFADSFVSIPPGSVDQSVFAVLLRTIEVALERQPEQADLHFHCGQVLARLGRHGEAIDANERAVGLNPQYTRALIALGKLYQQTDQLSDATQRLEEAVSAGAEYADVFCTLGDLYRDGGDIPLAKRAYEQALRINSRYHQAREALEALTT